MTQQLDIVDGVLQVHPIARVFTTFGWSRSTELLKDADVKRMKKQAELIAAGGEPSKADAVMREFWWQGQKADDQPLSELVNDIKARGLDKPISIFEGQILDGQARYEACKRAGFMLNPDKHFEYLDFPSWTEALRFVVGANILRRHLSLAERLELLQKLNAVGRQGPGRPKTSPIGEVSEPAKTSPIGEDRKTRREVAEIIGLNPRTLDRIDAVDTHGVDGLKEMVRNEKVKPGPAEQVARLPEAEQRDLVAQGPEAVRQRAAALRREPALRPVSTPVEQAARLRKAEAKAMEQLGNAAHLFAQARAHFGEQEPSSAEVRRRARALLAKAKEEIDALHDLLAELDEDALARMARGEAG